MRVVFESHNRQECSDRALVLASLQIPHEVIHEAGSSAVVVPAEFSARAVAELRQYELENPPQRPVRAARIVYHNAIPGLAGYLLLILLFALLDSVSALSHNWQSAGRIDGELLRNGEWWRAVTALTLHADLKHLAGNAIFGLLFGLFAGRLLGSGVAWLGILCCAFAGNLLNTLLLDPSHGSIGASTAVFAALGIVAGHVWRARLMRQDRWPYRIGPVVGGLALLMYTGTGGPNTDVGAHLMGFVCGFAGGILLVPLRGKLSSPTLQYSAAAGTVLTITTAWVLALAV